MKQCKGFTLAESIISLAIIAIAFTFLLKSLTMGVDESFYRSSLKEITILVESLLDSNEIKGELKPPYNHWKYYKKTININGDNYVKLIIISPRGEIFSFFRWIS